MSNRIPRCTSEGKRLFKSASTVLNAISTIAISVDPRAAMTHAVTGWRCAIERGALCEVFQEERVTKRDAGSCPAEQGCLQGTREDAVLAGGDIARQVSRLLFVDAGSARLGELDRERNEEALDARRPRTRPFSRSLPQISATKWSATLAMRSGPERSRLPTLSRTRAISMNSGLPACSRER